MNIKHRQLTLKGVLKRKAAALATTEKFDDEDCEQLEKEIAELKRELEQKQSTLAQIQNDVCSITNTLKPLKLKKNQEPEELKDALTRKAELEELCWRQKLVLGLDVAEYDESYFTIVYNTQHDHPSPTEYGLRIDVVDDVPAISKYSLPTGFNLSAVVGQFENIKQTEALTAVWTALVAFHERQRNYRLLKELMPVDVSTFTVLDTSHVELRMALQRADSGRAADVAIDLDYDVADVVAHTVHIRTDMTPEEEEVLKKQCTVFAKQPLHKAFSECFLEQQGLWQCCVTQEESEEETPPPQELVPRETRAVRRMPRRAAYSDDDSWLPAELPLRRS